MGEWQPIETAKAVGKKRLLFMLANGKQAVGWRLAKSDLIMPEGGAAWYKASHWMNLPEPPDA